MKVLIACEYSGIVREAMNSVGFDATSCDILPTEIAGKHYQGNVMDIDGLVNNKLKDAHSRSKTFHSIANAMAIQWSSFLL